MSPPPWEREGDHDEHGKPSQRHPPCGVEPHEVGPATRLRTEVVPPPFPAIAGFGGVPCERHAESSLSSTVQLRFGGGEWLRLEPLGGAAERGRVPAFEPGHG